MTLPTIVAAKYAGNIAKAALLAKADRSGAERTEPQIISVPSGQVVGTIIGLAPFRQGAMFDYNSTVIADALGAAVTVSLGYIYNDNITYTNNQTAFLALTAANTANTKLSPTVGANVNWKAPLGADGFIVATIGGATTGTTGNLNVQINLIYDQA